MYADAEIVDGERWAFGKAFKCEQWPIGRGILGELICWALAYSCSWVFSARICENP